eukprot:6680616-Ditylum_brightwellii.AAC.1
MARVVAVKLNFGTELKHAIEKLEKIEIEKPMQIVETADALDKAIFAKEVKEYVRNRGILKEVKKQAYVLLWGQCSKATQKKLRTQEDFATVEDKEDVIGLLKCIKAAIFQFNNQKDMYMAIADSIQNFWSFYQGKDMNNAAFLNKYQSLAE